MGESNKTLPPTEKKLQDARKEGNFLYSGDVTQLVVLIFGLMAVAVTAYRLPTEFNRLLELSFRAIASENFAGVAQQWVMTLVFTLVEFGLIVYGTVAIFAIGASIAQVGFVFQGARIKKGVTFEQGLNVVTNAKNLFSKQSLATFLMNVIKVIVICYIAYYVIKNDKILIDEIYACRLDLLCGLKVSAMKILVILVYIAVVMIPLAALDWFIHYKIYIGQNMMGHDDLEREHRESEGDPHLKGHRRQFAREIVSEGDFARVGKASAIIRNPTHIAIAVRYEPATMSIPYVVAMGTEHEALEIIREAEKAGVPSYVNIPLARAMLVDSQVNSFVPLRHMDSMIKFMHWLTANHPERVFETSEFGNIASVGGVGNVRRQ